MNLNRIICILYLLLFFTGEGSVSHAADSWSYPNDDPEMPYGGGTGTQSDPYQISTAQHLANLAYMVNDGKEYKGKYFVMTNDITLNENVIASDGKNTQHNYDQYKIWKPIGRCGYFSDDVFSTPSPKQTRRRTISTTSALMILIPTCRCGSCQTWRYMCRTRRRTISPMAISTSRLTSNTNVQQMPRLLQDSFATT